MGVSMTATAPATNVRYAEFASDEVEDRGIATPPDENVFCEVRLSVHNRARKVP